MSKRKPKPKPQPTPASVSAFLDKTLELHYRRMEDNPGAHPTFIASVALEAKKARVPLMRLREIANNTKNPQVWRLVSAYIINNCRV